MVECMYLYGNGHFKIVSVSMRMSVEVVETMPYIGKVSHCLWQMRRQY